MEKNPQAKKNQLSLSQTLNLPYLVPVEKFSRPLYKQNWL